MDAQWEIPTGMYDSAAAAVANAHIAGATAARQMRTARARVTTMSATTLSTNADWQEASLPAVCVLMEWPCDMARRSVLAI
jgi:hypothetical protein